jgi:hypothetical protein
MQEAAHDYFRGSSVEHQWNGIRAKLTKAIRQDNCGSNPGAGRVFSLPPPLHTFSGRDSQLCSVIDSVTFTKLFCNEGVFHTLSMVAVKYHAGLSPIYTTLLNNNVHQPIFLRRILRMSNH